MSGIRVGIAHHLGWAVAVAASADHTVLDRRRIELVEPGLPAAPVHHVGGPHALHRAEVPLDDAELEALVARVRDSAARASSSALRALAASLPAPVVSLSLAAWAPDFPADVALQRRVPYESRADSVMYRQVLADAARRLGWAVHLYDPKNVEPEAGRLLGPRAHDVLHGPRAALGSPWSKDHRTALAATVVASAVANR